MRCIRINAINSFSFCRIWVLIYCICPLCYKTDIQKLYLYNTQPVYSYANNNWRYLERLEMEYWFLVSIRWTYYTCDGNIKWVHEVPQAIFSRNINGFCWKLVNFETLFRENSAAVFFFFFDVLLKGSRYRQFGCCCRPWVSFITHIEHISRRESEFWAVQSDVIF